MSNARVSDMRVCRKCGEAKPATQAHFYKNGAHLRAVCKKCQLEKLRKPNPIREIDAPTRFWLRTNKQGPVVPHVPGLDPCWEWTGARQSDGYGQSSYLGKVLLTHRLAWMFHYGEMPALQVLHRCDNRPCCNPAHLFLGTNADNVADKVAKGRARTIRGEAHHSHRLRESDVHLVRKLLRNGISQQKIADRFGVTQVAIGAIALGRSWKWLL
jgi:hypothetical protein